MTTYRYRTTLRAASQLNLLRLCYVPGSDLPPTLDRYDHGSFCTTRELTPFEVSQLDLELIGIEEGLREEPQATGRCAICSKTLRILKIGLLATHTCRTGQKSHGLKVTQRDH